MVENHLVQQVGFKLEVHEVDERLAQLDDLEDGNMREG